MGSILPCPCGDNPHVVDTSALSDSRFRAMGSDCHVLIHGGTAEDLTFAEAEVRRLEALWSRFREDSEVSRLNAADGSPAPVSVETMALLCRAVRAQRLTGGWFDPFMGRDIVGLGYGQDFGELTQVSAAPGVSTYRLDAGASAPRLERVIPDASLGVTRYPLMAQLPPGFDFDPGGVGKGLGADLVTLALLRRGVPGALVNLGGDLRCRGRHPDDGWEVTIGNPLDGGTLEEFVRLTDGAVATSTPLKRRWIDGGGQIRNHLFHPARGESIEPEVASVSVIAPTGWLAEALCKALLIGGPDVGRPLLNMHRAAGIVVTLDGSVIRL
jgi:thiamine biosynthesis lipoprotein